MTVYVNDIVHEVPLVEKSYTLHLDNISPQNTVRFDDHVVMFDKPNPQDFSFAAVSCQHTLSSSEVYQHV